MPRTTETFDLHAEADRLDDRLDALADQAADADPDSTAYREATEEATLVEQQLVGVRWALHPDSEDRDPYESITLGGLTTGEYAHVADRVEAARQERVGFGHDDGSVAGVGQVFFVAAGLVDAPFLDDTGFDAKARAVNQLPPQFTRWLEARVDDLTTPTVDVGNSFEQRVAAKQSSQPSNSPSDG